MLHVETFRQPKLAVLLARAGAAISRIALPLLVYDLTNSARLLGLHFVIQVIPRVLLSPIGRLLADRLERRDRGGAGVVSATSGSAARVQ